MLFVGTLKKVVISETEIHAEVWADFSLKRRCPRRLYSLTDFPYIPTIKDIRQVYRVESACKGFLGVTMLRHSKPIVSVWLFMLKKLLWGREIDLKGINTNWQELSLREMSFEIEKVVPTLFDEIDYPIVGGIGTIETVGFKHIVTFVAIDLILHTCINSKE